MRFVEGIKNLITTPAKRNKRQSRLRIVPTADQMQTDAVWNLLAEQIEHGWDESLPKPAPNPDDLYRPTLIGAWSKNRLVGGAFVMPDSQDAKAFTSIGADKAAQAFERSCCMIQGIAVAADQAMLRPVGRTARRLHRPEHTDERRRRTHERESRL